MRFIVVMWSGDVRECRSEGHPGNYRLVHVLNSAWSISPNDPQIRKIKIV